MALRRRVVVSISVVCLGWVAGWALAQSPQEKIEQALRIMNDKNQRQQCEKLLQEARSELDALIKANPKDAAAHFHLANALFYLQEDQNALAALDRAIGLSPKEPHYPYRKGEILLEMEKPEQAKEAFLQAASIDPANAKPVLMAGVAMAQQSKHAEALPYFVKATQLDPKYVMAWSNVGQANQSLGKTEEALNAYRTGWNLDKRDYKLLSKIIQCEQALGQLPHRDADRETLLKLYADGAIPARLYCRDQFVVDGTRVMALEYFELKGEQALRYAFQVLDNQGKTAWRITLGSYEATTQYARETGAIGKDERMFHLDGYKEKGHETYGMFKKEPSYDQVRQKVIAILSGKAKPASSSHGPADKP